MSGVWVQFTPAARRFREQAGYANFRLNTIVVGLEAVKHGNAVKPVDLAVNWQPKDVGTAADRARTFATSAIMVYVVDALDGYMGDLGRSGAFIRNPDIASILSGEFQTDRTEIKPISAQIVQEFVDGISPSNYDLDALEQHLRDFTARHFGRRKRPSLRMRFETLSAFVGTVPAHYQCAVHFLISWRNRHVHGRSTDHVSNQILSGLREASCLFRDDHAHLDVSRMIDNYEGGRSPTLKEISSLISIAHRVVAYIDEAILRSADAHRVFITALRTGFGRAESPQARLKNYWGKSVEKRQIKLVAMASCLGFREAGDGDLLAKPLFLTQDQVRAIAEMERQSFADLISPLSTIA